MNLEVVLDEIVNEVVRRLNQRLKSAIVVFTGGALGFEDALEQLRVLKSEGWNFKVLLTSSAEHVFLPGSIEEVLGTNEVYYERKLKGLGDFYRDTSLLIVPTLTLNTLSKISMQIVDSAVTNLVSHYITTGTPIIAANDACDLTNPVREKYRMDKSPKAYLAMNAHHLNQLKAYGIHLVRAVKIAEAARTMTFQLQNKGQQPVRKGETVIKYTDRILTRNAVYEAMQKKAKLIVSKQTIVTPLAHDAARQFGVTIEIEKLG